jgi:hypothetical protein
VPPMWERGGRSPAPMCSECRRKARMPVSAG